MAAVYGLSIATAALLATMAALGLMDYLLRFQDRGLRIIASLLVLGTLGLDLLPLRFCGLAGAPAGCRSRLARPAAVSQPGRSTPQRRGVSARRPRRSGGRFDGAPPGDGRRDHGGDRAAGFLRGARSAADCLGCPGAGRGVPSGRRVRRARSVGLADRRRPAGKPFRHGRLAADEPFGDSPAGGARCPGTGLPDRSGRCPRRPAAVGSPHPLPLRRARCRGRRGDRSPAIRGRRDDGTARERSAAVFLSRGRRRRPVDAVVRRPSGRAAGHRGGVRAVDPAGLYRLAARAGQAEHSRLGGHPRRDRCRGYQAAQIGPPVLGRRSANTRSARRRRQATERRLHRREIRLLLARSDRPRGP